MKPLAGKYTYNDEQQQLLEKLADELLPLQWVRNFLVSNHLPETFVYYHLADFLVAKKALDLCAGCKSLENCVQASPGYRLCPEYDEGQFALTLLACDYQQRQDAKLAHLDYFVVRDYPLPLAELSLTRMGEVDTNFKNTVNTVYKAISSKQNAYLYGAFGVGKTYLAAIIANTTAALKKTVAFCHVPSLARETDQYRFDKEWLASHTDLLESADLLVLDDIGAEIASAFFRDGVLLPVLDRRMIEHRPVLYTANLNPAALQVLYSSQSRNQDSMSAPRLLERIKTNTVILEMKGRNRRE